MKNIKIEYLQTIFIAILCASVISPPLANLFEIVLITVVVFNQPFKDNFRRYTQTIDFKIHLAFIALLAVGIFYPIVDTETYLSSILSWRKFLLLPIGMVLFQNTMYTREKGLKQFFYCMAGLTILASLYRSQLLPFFNVNVIKYQIGTTSSEGMFIAVAIAIALTSLFTHNQLLGTSSRMTMAWIGFFVGYIAFFTTGRSGYLAMLMVVITLSYGLIGLGGKYIHIKFASVAVLVFMGSVLLLINSHTASGRIQQAWHEFTVAETNAINNINTSIGQRMIFWKNTMAMVPNHYLMGVGTGGFKAAYAQQVKDKSGLEGAVTQDPHNQYMKILVEQGVVGLALFLWMIGRCLKQSLHHEKPYLLGASVLLIWIMTSAFNAHFTTFMEGTFIWAWMGLMQRKGLP